MQKKRGFLKGYLILAVALAIVSIVDGVLTILRFENKYYTFTLLIIACLFFLFNILVIPLFHYQRMEKIAYFLPIYYIISYLIFTGAGIYFSLTEIMTTLGSIIFQAVNFLTALLEISFIFYLWRKLISKKANLH